MTRINIALRKDTAGGPVAVVGSLIAQRTKLRIDGAIITYPGEIRFPLPGRVDLDPPALGEAWKLHLYSSVGSPIFRTAIFGGGEIDFDDLVDVDPKTLQPTEEPPTAAWTAALEALTDRVASVERGESGAATGGIVFRQTAPAAQWTIPHSLGRRPSVTLYADDGSLMLSDITADADLVVVTYATPTAGSAVLI